MKADIKTDTSDGDLNERPGETEKKFVGDLKSKDTRHPGNRQEIFSTSPFSTSS